jgi:fermentation-respiration switch protein FrsA (DUF1100 family)
MSFRGFAATTLVLGGLACGDDQAAEDGRGGGGGDAPDVTVIDGCDGAKLLASSDDTSARGPWAVGARTLTIDGLTVEAWYPAAADSAGSATARVYDVRAYLPPSEMGKISDADAPLQACDCYGDLPIDGAHGPYPVIVFVHGTAGFRTQSLELVTHWASRGFVVLAADHPGLYLRDLLGSVCGAGNVARDLQADLDALVGAIRSGTGLEGLAPSIAGDRIAMIGHSAGGAAISARGDVAQVLVPMASGGVEPGALLRSSLVLGAVEDQVVDYAQQTSGYEASPAPKRFVGLSPAGHLAFSSLCAIQNAAGQDIVAIGQANDVCGLSLAGALFDCDPAYVAPAVGWSIVNEATSAVLEETLHCSAGRAGWLSGIQSRHAEVAEYREQASP